MNKDGPSIEQLVEHMTACVSALFVRVENLELKSGIKIPSGGAPAANADESYDYVASMLGTISDAGIKRVLRKLVRQSVVIAQKRKGQLFDRDEAQTIAEILVP